ncbi:cyclic nucleotide-binding domain (cNMP-BD) protein [Oleiphilus messinensis]|uniref:Cyclic nucleotide-binding domain (cNMP-BD) protein n=1 Tax=Oleiphilus messinensis TaxID=141451 RepID=A0A1Y0IEF1_9GAMM|nr:DUF294 nucleotidyltransferase-like domain-containing protein [Oleiphilus messinensis]ARU57763.1 cyclic nucleotide-binding domain (cNMP-BD) protein [Oleiphilus messinensis]
MREKSVRFHNTASLINFLQHHAPFNQMSDVDLEFVVENTQIAFFSKGDMIVSPETGVVDELFIVKKGLVRGYRNNAQAHGGDTAVTLSPGECFPLAAMVAERATQTCHEAVEDTFCFILNKSGFIELLFRSAVFSDFAARGVSALLQLANQQLKANASVSIHEGYSLETPLEQLARNNPIVCSPDIPLKKAIEIMDGAGIGSIIATNENRRAIGIFTLRDLRKVIAAPEVDLNIPLEQVMTTDPKSLPQSATAFDAAVLMAEHHFAHICLTNDDGKLVGVVSERDLFSLQRVNLVHLTRAIAHANSFTSLIQIREDIPGLIHTMLAHGASVTQINRLITVLNDYTVRRVLELAIRHYPHHLPDFTWLSFGSEAREEQTLVTDQDNGIIFHTSGHNEQEADREALLAFARLVTQYLDQCGFTLCKGNIMASNPALCLTLAEWKNKFERLVRTTTPENLLQSTILFDMRAIWGDESMVDELYDHLLKRIGNNTLFQKMLAGNALQNRAPLGFFRGFKFSKSKSGENKGKRIDMKTQGLNPFIEAIRVLALANDIRESNTLKRLSRLTELKVFKPADSAAWEEAYSFIQMQRMKHHQDCVSAGTAPDNMLDPEILNPLDRRVLKEAFRQAQRIQQVLELRYQL